MRRFVNTVYMNILLKQIKPPCKKNKTFRYRKVLFFAVIFFLKSIKTLRDSRR